MKLLIDCDPGHDDAAAILYAAAHLELVGITTVFGNQDVGRTTYNALRVCTLGELDIPVAQGAGQPLIGTARPIPEAHGKTGIDGGDLPEPLCEPVSMSAVELILEQAYKHRGELVLAAVAPLTNVATAILAEPRLKGWLKAITLMGGSTSVGNVTPVAEFNIYSDPEAAHVVFNSGIPLYMCGLNVTRQVGVTRQDITELQNSGKRTARVFAGLFEFYLERLEAMFGLESASLHDACVLMPFTGKTFLTLKKLHVNIELAPGFTRGMTVCDMRYVGSSGTVVGGNGITSGQAWNAHVAVAVKGAEAARHVLATIMAYP